MPITPFLLPILALLLITTSPNPTIVLPSTSRITEYSHTPSKDTTMPSKYRPTVTSILTINESGIAIKINTIKHNKLLSK